MATIHDVARLAAVAPSTVSLVANGKPTVRPATRKRVEAAIRQLGYRGRKGRSAATLTTTTTPSAPGTGPHILMCYTRDAVHDGEMVTLCREVVAGVRQVMQARQARMSLFAGAEHVDKDLMFRDCLEAGGFDGILLVSPQPGEGYLEAALAVGVPMVTINRLPRHNEFSSVCVDYYGAGRKAARHFMKLGHQRMAIITTRKAHWPSWEYHAGFTEALAARGLEPALELQPPSDMPQADDDRALARQIIDAGVTAIFAGDQRAVTLADELQRQGIHVPDEVSLLGLDNLGLCTQAGQRLSSIGFPKRGMGRMAARLMLRLVQRSCRFQHASLSVPTRLYRGQTTKSVSKTDVSTG